MHFSKFFGNISDSFEFQTYRVKAMAKEKIVNITVTYNMKKQPAGVIFKKSSYYNFFGCGALFYVSIFFVVQDPGQFAASKLVLIFSKNAS